jgi:hypothetical protein
MAIRIVTATINAATCNAILTELALGRHLFFLLLLLTPLLSPLPLMQLMPLSAWCSGDHGC